MRRTNTKRIGTLTKQIDRISGTGVSTNYSPFDKLRLFTTTLGWGLKTKNYYRELRLRKSVSNGGSESK
jgi:hypothetical protein